MKKLNNKGFSLVELIIVIAIMVILVAVIAPQYLKFVNNSKISTDIQTASDMVTAIDADIADNDTTKPFSAADTLVPANVENLAAWPMSKYTTNNTSWKVYGNNDTGVSKVTLKINNVEYEVYPNPDNATNGYNKTFKK